MKMRENCNNLYFKILNGMGTWGLVLQRILALILSELALISIKKVGIHPNFLYGNERKLS